MKKNTTTLVPDPNSPVHPTPRRTHFKGWLRQWWIWILLLILLAIGVYALAHRAPAEKPQGGGGRGGAAGGKGAVTPVVAQSAKSGDINVYQAGLGTVLSNTVTVKSRVDGQLIKINFREGQLVRQGDLLAQIDPRSFQVALTQAEGQAARDQSLLANAKIDLERYKTLFAQDSIAKQQLDTQAALVRQYEGTLKVDQGAIDNAKLQLSYTRVTAPISGRLGLNQVDAGNMIHASDANGLVVITKVQPITVTFSIPEDSLPPVMAKLRNNEKLPVDAFDRSQKNKLASGFLLTADNQIDPATGTVKLKAQFANDDFALFPNQFVNINMLVDTRHNATLIPSSAIQRGTQGTFVYVVKEDSTVTLRPIKLGATEGANTAADSGLAPGEMVVVDGADKLREGAKVSLPGKDTGAATPDGGTKKRGGGGGRKRRDANTPAAQ